MSTLAQIRARIADDLNRSDLNSQIDKAINRAIEYYYKSERFWFNETLSNSLSTITGQESYSTLDGLPSDLIEFDYISIILSATNYQELRPSTFQWIQQTNVGRATGTPTNYAWYQNKLYLYLIPNNAYNLNIFYRKSYATLVNDSDTNDFTNYAEDLIEARASWWLYERILKNYDAAAQSKAEENDSLLALQARTQDIVPVPSIQPTTF